MGKYCAKYSKQQSCIWDFVVKVQRLLLYFFYWYQSVDE